MISACILILSLSGEPVRCGAPEEVAAMIREQEDQWERLRKALAMSVGVGQ